jgi:rfaE bifunctional protein kinase chain/domain
MKTLSNQRIRDILDVAAHTRVLVIGDLMLDQFIWGRVDRISPEAPVPVVQFERESFMPGGAANVARNLTALHVPTELFGVLGQDDFGKKLNGLLIEQNVGCQSLLFSKGRTTSIKTRIIAHQQQVVRVDRESAAPIDAPTTAQLIKLLADQIDGADAVIIGDYGKGVVSQTMLEAIKELCHSRGIWLSVDPKPIHQLQLTGLSLITPNRKEAFEMADVHDGSRASNPTADSKLMHVAEILLGKLQPALLLITLGDQGMLLCRRAETPFHIPTVAREVYDVSGAGDSVIASFTMAIAAGASPVEAAIISNHAAGVVVGKVGTATVTGEELLASFRRSA